MADWPGCMAPDGGEACAEYSELHGKYHLLRAQADEMAASIEEFSAWRARVFDAQMRGKLDELPINGGEERIQRMEAALARYRGEGT